MANEVVNDIQNSAPVSTDDDLTSICENLDVQELENRLELTIFSPSYIKSGWYVFSA